MGNLQEEVKHCSLIHLLIFLQLGGGKNQIQRYRCTLTVIVSKAFLCLYIKLLLRNLHQLKKRHNITDITQPWFDIVSFPDFKKLNADHVILKLSILQPLQLNTELSCWSRKFSLAATNHTILGIQHRPNSCNYNWGERVSCLVITAITFLQGAMTLPWKAFLTKKIVLVLYMNSCYELQATVRFSFKISLSKSKALESP